MDPISAAGIGLSVTSLALQVFAGCVKGRLSSSVLLSCSISKSRQHTKYLPMLKTCQPIINIIESGCVLSRLACSTGARRSV